MSEESKLPEPVTRGDMYLNVILNGNKDGDELPAPLTRIEMYLKALLDKLESGSGAARRWQGGPDSRARR